MNTSGVRTGVLAWAMLGAASGLRAAEGPPRYDLKPGQVLTYREDQSFRGPGENSRYRFTWRFWVVGDSDDGGWTIVVRQGSKDLPTLATAGREILGALRGRRADDQPERVSFARFDLRPDGTIPWSPSLGSQVDPTDVFPRLPDDATEAASGWRLHDDRDDLTIRYTPRGAGPAGDGSTFTFEADQASFMEKVYEGRDRRTFRFDRDRGRVAGAEIEREYGSHINSKGSGTLELVSVEELPPGDMTAFRAQMDRFFEAHEAYLKLYRRAETAGDESEELLRRGRAILAEARAEVTLPEPAAALDEQLSNHDRFAESQIETARNFARLIGHPAPEWEIADLDGRTYTLEQYRGRVVVLDFWYRGCGWCMRAMPQLKKLAAEYRDRPVSVLAMNKDQDEDDARFVARVMQLDYPVLRSLDLPEKYGVRGFPTLIVIDREGKVADVHVGYSPRLLEEVSEVVDRLLGAE